MSNNQKTKDDLRIEIEDKIIRNSTEINILGMKINDKLNWKSSLVQGNESLLHQLKIRNYTLKKVSKFLDPTMKKMYANAIIRGKYSYGMENWGGAGKTEIKQIQIQQNKAARIATFDRKNPNKSTGNCLKELKWLSIEKEIEYVTHIKTFKTINSEIDDEMHYLIPKILTMVDFKQIINWEINLKIL